MKLLKLFSFYGLAAFRVILRDIFYKYKLYVSKVDDLIADVYDYKMVVPLKYDGIGRILYVLGERELDHKWMLESELKEGDVVLDLGVNFGYYALMESRRIGASGKIYAIEPDPRNIEYLGRNIELNKIQDIIQYEQGAISNKSGTAKFTLSERTNLNSFSLESHEGNAIDVKVIDFSEYLVDKPIFDMVRMDIEGHEIEVFDSLCRYAESNADRLPRKIIFETHLRVYNKSERMTEILQRLYDLGYRIKTLSSSNEKTTALHGFGYEPFKVVKDFPFIRGVYENVQQEHAVECITRKGGVRTVLLELVK